MAQRKPKELTPEERETALRQHREMLAAQQRRDDFLRELGRRRQELMDISIRTSIKWHAFRTGPMQELVAESLRAARVPEDLRREDGWWPLGGEDWQLPRSWVRDVPDVLVERRMPWGQCGTLVSVERPRQEVLIPIVDSEVSGRPVVCVYPPTWYDYCVAFGLEDINRERWAMLSRNAVDYDGPGGVMIARPFVYHGPEGGYSIGEFYRGMMEHKEAA